MVITDVLMRNVTEGNDVEVCVTLAKKSLQDVRAVLSIIDGDATSKEFVCFSHLACTAELRAITGFNSYVRLNCVHVYT